MSDETEVAETESKSRSKTSKTTIVTLISRLEHPVTLSYKDSNIVIPPRGRANKIEKRQLGAIPKGILVKEIK